MGSVEVLGRGVDALEQRGPVGEGALVGALDRVVQELLDLAADLVLLLVREVGVLAEPGAEALERIALGPLLEHLPGDVGSVVVNGVTLHAEAEELEEGRARALAGPLERLLGLPVDRED